MRESTLRERDRIERPSLPPAERPAAEAAEEADILDWDVAIEAPPPRRSGAVRVALEYAGRGRPIPIVDSSAE